MTLDEKVAQLGSVWAFELVPERTELDDGSASRDRRADGIGHITRLAGATNLGRPASREAANGIQRFLVEETRLGIPAIVHEETLHGLLACDAPCFQQSIGAAASFDPAARRGDGGHDPAADAGDRGGHALWRRSSTSPATRAGAGSRRPTARTRTSPRCSAAPTSAALQGDDLADGVAATAKHLVGHGLAEGGLNQAPAHVGPRELRDEQLLPVRGGRPGGRHRAASCPRTATSTACPAMRRTSC